MNLFSRIGAAFSAAPKRLSMALQTAGFEGAMSKRRLIAWKATEENINSLVAEGGDLLRARARQIVRSNPYAANAANSFVANAVGDGIRPSSLIEDQEIKNQIAQAWKDWVLEADADGLTDFYGMQGLVAHALFEAGECFVRFRPRRPTDGLTVPLQLQLLESEMLPLSKIELGPTGNAVRCGIEFDRIGRRVAYHFYRKHPGDNTETGNKGEIVRVPASEVLHIYPTGLNKRAAWGGCVTKSLRPVILPCRTSSVRRKKRATPLGWRIPLLFGLTGSSKGGLRKRVNAVHEHYVELA